MLEIDDINVEIAKKMIEDGTIEYRDLSEKLRSSVTLAKVAFKDNTNYLHCGENLKNDKKFNYYVAEYHSDCVQFMSKELRDNEDFCKFAIEKDPYNFQYCSYRIKDNEKIAKMAIEKYSENFQYCSLRLKDNEKFCKLIFKKSKYNFVYCSERLKNNNKFIKFYISTFNKHSFAIDLIPEEKLSEPEIIEAIIDKLNEIGDFRYEGYIREDITKFITENLNVYAKLNKKLQNNRNIKAAHKEAIKKQTSPFEDSTKFTKSILDENKIES